MRLTNYVDRLEKLSKKELKTLDAWVCTVARTQDDAEGFAHFYAYMTRGDIPQHAYNWIDKVYIDKSNDMGTLIFAFRGSWKTTTISILFTAFRIGKTPWKANLILSNNDASAQNITLAIADIVDKDPRWKDIFPNVVPDKKKGWGAQGYWVRDTSKSDEEWAELTNITKDPTLLGLGISSGSVIGKHPTGVLIMDDIHDESNTVSETERAKIVKIVTDTVLPMAVTDSTKKEGQQLETFTLIVGTPWHETDAYHYLRDTGEFGFLYSPLLYPASPETDGAVEFNHKKLIGWFKLAWEERIPYKAVISLYNKTGHKGFGRMYLLSLAMANELGLEYLLFPEEELPDPDTVEVVSGVDYASMMEIRGKVISAKNRSKFALAWGYILPSRVVVVVDGIVGHFTQLKAEGHVQTVQARFKRHRTTAVEMNGKGEEFFNVLARNPTMDLFPHWTGKQSKPDRLEMELGPWLEMGKIMISDADTPFLNELRNALMEFPHGNLDVLDAIYGVTRAVPDVMIVNEPEKEKLVTPQGKRVLTNPFSAFGARRYGS